MKKRCRKKVAKLLQTLCYFFFFSWLIISGPVQMSVYFKSWLLIQHSIILIVELSSASALVVSQEYCIKLLPGLLLPCNSTVIIAQLPIGWAQHKCKYKLYYFIIIFLIIHNAFWQLIFQLESVCIDFAWVQELKPDKLQAKVN